MAEEPVTNPTEPETAEQKTETAELEGAIRDVQSAEIKEMQARIEEATKAKSSQMYVDLEAARRELADVRAENDALKRQISKIEHDAKVRELQREYEALTKAPVIQTTAPGRVEMAAAPKIELDTDEFPAYTIRDME